MANSNSNKQSNKQSNAHRQQVDYMSFASVDELACALLSERDFHAKQSKSNVPATREFSKTVSEGLSRSFQMVERLKKLLDTYSGNDFVESFFVGPHKKGDVFAPRDFDLRILLQNREKEGKKVSMWKLANFLVGQLDFCVKKLFRGQDISDPKFRVDFSVVTFRRYASVDLVIFAEDVYKLWSQFDDTFCEPFSTVITEAVTASRLAHNETVRLREEKKKEERELLKKAVEEKKLENAKKVAEEKKITILQRPKLTTPTPHVSPVLAQPVPVVPSAWDKGAPVGLIPVKLEPVVEESKSVSVQTSSDSVTVSSTDAHTAESSCSSTVVDADLATSSSSAVVQQDNKKSKQHGKPKKSSSQTEQTDKDAEWKLVVTKTSKRKQNHTHSHNHSHVEQPNDLYV